MAPVTFDEALTALLGLIGRRVEVSIFDAGGRPHLVATFGGTLIEGRPIGDRSAGALESIYVRIEGGEEVGSISLDREVFTDAIAHSDGSLTLQLGGVEMLIGKRPEPA
ncbi:hypothetical protein HJD18_10335 [Thermoleophilia bacterium SCSIO 60948]|nr:hypothetical protein HJD18_10335 [Thermoleophilia bacterium SCSIO 60948]